MEKIDDNLANNNGTSEDKKVSIPEKPVMLPIKWENIPLYLTTFPNFIFWKYILEDGEWKKSPIGKWGSIDERNTFDNIKKMWGELKNKDEIGLGFVFDNNNDVIGIDIDKYTDDKTKPIPESILGLIDGFNCYTEVSPSGTGAHILARVKDKSNVPVTATFIEYHGCHHIEYYPNGRWFAMTGYKSKHQNDLVFINENKLKELVGTKLKSEVKELFKMPDVVEAGGRNNMLFKLACSMRSKGLLEQSILAALREENVLKCKPPLQENDIITIAGQAAKYNPSSPILPDEPIKQVSLEEISKMKFDQTEPFKYPFKDDLIFKYMDFHKDMSDAYIDFHHADAMIVLSTIIDRKVLFKTKQVTIYTNIWNFIIAQSTLGRKTTIINQIYDFSHLLNKAGRVELPKQFTPESLTEILSETPHTYYINDECAGLMKSMTKKSYMADLRDIMCGLYENRGYSKKLRTKKTGEKSNFIVTNPYIPMLFATTPNNISRYAEYDDFASGWLVRFMYYYPQYEKPYMSLTEQTSEDFMKKNKLTQDIARLEEFFSGISTPIQFIFSENADKYFKEWGKCLETQMADMDDDILQSAAGRLQIYAIKLAMIYEIAKDNFIDNFRELEGLMGKIDSWDGMEFRYPISLPVIQEACREIDEYFLPMAKRVSKLIEAGDLKNDQVAIINVLKRKGGQASRTEVARMTHLSAKQLREAIESLVNDSEEIEILESKAEGSCKPTTYLRMKEVQK